MKRSRLSWVWCVTGMAGLVLLHACSSSSGPQCTLDTDCQNGEYCAVDGKCYESKDCETDADCEADEYCSSLNDCRKKGQPDGGDNQDGNGNDDDGGTTLPDLPICDIMEIESGDIPPNLLLVVDKSGSMRDSTPTGTKMSDLKAAVNAMLDAYPNGEIRFGWMQYPRDSECAPGTVADMVECADDSVPDIRTRVNALSWGGGTPTGTSLENANDYQGLHDESRNNYIILLTDGMPTCPVGNGTEVTEQDKQRALEAVQDLYAAAIDTFVIGLGQDLNNTNPDLLNQMAEAGGHPRAGAVKYYQANDMNELNAVLQAIGGMVIGCNLGLTSVPEYPAYLWVFFDGEAITRDRDHVDGWDYDTNRNQINFYGPTCDRLRSGSVTKVEVIMGCEPPP